MRSLGLLTLLPLVLGACRFGFDEVADQPADSGTDGAPTLLSCDNLPAFSVAGTPRKVAATAWRDGYLVVTADAAGTVRGSTYTFAGADLVADRQDVMLATGMSGVGSVGTVAFGDQTLLVVPHDNGTELITLDPQLAQTKVPAEQTAWLGGVATAATNSAGKVAFIAQHATSNEVAVFLIGGDPAPVVIAQPGDQAVSPTIMPAGADFLVVWDVVVSSRRVTRAQLLSVTGETLTTKIPATQLNKDVSADAENPRGAYLAGGASGDRHLTAWMKKVNGDEIWASLRTANLAADGPDLLLGAQGNEPRVAAGTTDFLVAWKAADTMYASRVSPAGAVTSLVVPTAGGAVADWDVVSRAGQAALVWVETGGAGTRLRFDPLCHR